MSALPLRTARSRASGAQSRQRPRLRVVGPVRHVRRYATVMTLVVALGVFGVVSLNALAARSSFEARTLENEVGQLSVRYDELTAEVARLESPARVRRVATRRLGMVRAEQTAFLEVESVRFVDGGDGSADPQDSSGTLAADVLADPVKQVLSPGK